MKISFISLLKFVLTISKDLIKVVLIAIKYFFTRFRDTTRDFKIIRNTRN